MLICEHWTVNESYDSGFTWLYGSIRTSGLAIRWIQSMWKFATNTNTSYFSLLIFDFFENRLINSTVKVAVIVCCFYATYARILTKYNTSSSFRYLIVFVDYLLYSRIFAGWTPNQTSFYWNAIGFRTMWYSSTLR